VGRNRPFGDEQWTGRVARRYGLESSLRNPWRPKKGPGNKRKAE
jgi:hypothetical protein